MGPTQELVDDIYAEKVRRARATPIEEKLIAGLKLYEMAHEAVRAGIRAQFPNLSPQEFEAKLRERRAIIARIEEKERMERNAWTLLP